MDERLNELVKWLHSERQELEQNGTHLQPDEAGYYGAIMNTLDFIQGATVYHLWKGRTENA